MVCHEVDTVASEAEARVLVVGGDDTDVADVKALFDATKEAAQTWLNQSPHVNVV